MRASWVMVVVLFAWCPLALAAEDTEAQRQEAVLKELHALRASVDKLSRRVQALEKKVDARAPQKPTAEEDLPEDGPSASFQPRGADREALSKITLPDHFTKDQAREYVRKIVAASASQNTCDPKHDPQVPMLEQVGPDNVDVLIDAMQPMRLTSYYLSEAIGQLARPDNKAQILAALPDHTGLVNVIIAQGWEADAKDVLLSKLKAHTGQLMPPWFQAVVNLGTPEAYDALKAYMVSGPQPAMAYYALTKAHAAGDLAPTVEKAWEAAKRHGNADAMAGIAATYGHLDAMEVLFDGISRTHLNPQQMAAARQWLTRYIPSLPADADIAGWFGKNQDKLVWDAKEKVYKLKQSPKNSR